MLINPNDFIDYRNVPSYQPGGRFVTADILRKIFPSLSVQRATLISDALDISCRKYGLDKPGLFHEFIATLGEESAEFTSSDEKLYYTTPERLVKVFRGHFANVAQAKPYLRNPEKLANYVYANRNGNGSVSSGDGWLFRGGGFIQCTGRDMYEAYAKYVGKPLMDVVTLIRTDMATAVDNACWIFVVVKKLLDEAENDQFDKITKAINGALTNYDKRLVYLDRAKKALPITDKTA